MAVVCKFVDTIASSPTTRLDLNDGTTWRLLLEGTEFGFPELRQAAAASMLRDGDEIHASAYGNRQLTLRLLLNAASQDAAATQLQTLHRELNRTRNILQYQPHGATSPVFARLFRSAPAREQPFPGMEDGRHAYEVVLTLTAEPFFYGLQETPVNGVTVNNDPAHATNPQKLEISAADVKGDVATPAFILIDSGQDARYIIGIRPRGTPSNAAQFVQAESGSASTDTSNPGGGPDASMSGAGTNNFLRTSFATNANMVTRLTITPFATDSVDLRGIYRVFARLRKSVAGDTIKVRLLGESGAGPTVTLPSVAGPFISDLGLWRVPDGEDPINDGYTNSEKAITATDVSLSLQAQRSAGTGNLDWDAAFFVPADEQLLLVDFGSQLHQGATGRQAVIDGPNDLVYIERIGPPRTVYPSFGTKRVGSIPMLVPNQTNRLTILKPRSSSSDVLGDSSTVTVSYWPRFLYIRP